MRISPYLLLLVASLCWAGNFVLGRAIHTQIPPITLNFWRWAVAGAVLLPFAVHQTWRSGAALGRHWRLILALSVLGVVLFNSIAYTALRTTTALNASLVLAVMPVAISVVAYVIDGERISRRQALGIGISLVGVVVVIARAKVATLLALRFAPGDFWLLVAVLTWAVYSVLLKRLPPDLSPVALLMAMTGMGLALLAPAYAWEFQGMGGFAVNAATLSAIAYVALFASVLAYVCWNRAVAEVGANKAGLFSHLVPVFAAVLAMVFLGESLRPYHLAGVAFIATGILLTTTEKGVLRRLLSKA